MLLPVHPQCLFKRKQAVYAPDPGCFACQPEEITFVSANAWDTHGATCDGFNTFWVSPTGPSPDMGWTVASQFSRP
nr:hypothetical protein [Roseomonas sp. SXEYE001]